MEAADAGDPLMQETSPARDLDPTKHDELLDAAADALTNLPVGTVIILSHDDVARCANVLPLPGGPYHLDQLRNDSYLHSVATPAALSVAGPAGSTVDVGNRGLANDAPSAADELGPLDPMFGPLVSLRETRRYPGEPTAMEAWSANVAAVGHFTEWIPDQAGAGVNFSRSAAQGAAIGEAAERYGGQVPTESVYASETTLRAEGRPVIGVAAWDLFTDSQHERPSWRFRRWSPGESLSWTTAQSITTAEDALVPTAHVLLGHGRRTMRSDPVSVPPLAGIAAGQTRQHAELSGLLELVERDATMRWWHGGHPARRLAEDSSQVLNIHDQLWDGVDIDVQLEFLTLPTEAAAHVVAAIFKDHELDLVGIGFAARTDLRSAMLKAAAEAWQLRRIDVDLLDPTSPLWTQVRNGQFKMPLRPFREDRCYLDDYATDYSCMRVLTDNLQFYLDPRALERVDQRLAETVDPASDLTAHDAPHWETTDLLDSTVAAEWRVLSVDMTPHDLACRGLHVARVLSPDLCPNAASAYTPWGHRHLRDAVVPSDLPLPHA
ncbi:MAG: hypothetical protein JWM84_2557 [Nocardioides sp.]|nr:hypothetical protein [Nocardioides sp.]